MDLYPEHDWLFGYTTIIRILAPLQCFVITTVTHDMITNNLENHSSQQHNPSYINPPNILWYSMAEIWLEPLT